MVTLSKPTVYYVRTMIEQSAASRRINTDIGAHFSRIAELNVTKTACIWLTKDGDLMTQSTNTFVNVMGEFWAYTYSCLWV